MPLHAQHEVAVRPFEPLDHAVRRAGHDPKPGADPVGRLVVRGVDRHALAARHPGEQAVRPDLDLVLGHAPGGVGASMANLLADVIGQVLEEIAAVGDVQHLGAAADREDRHAPPLGLADRLDLEYVELGLGRAELRVAGAAVVLGIHVRSPRDA